MNLMDVYKFNGRQVRLCFVSDEIFFGVDIAIPCGLIVNELITNSLKYAFADREKGMIELLLNNLGNGNYKITVKDDGIGFPKSVNFRKTKSLGLQLVNTLVKQIDAKIEMKNSAGTEFTITFNDPLH
jgi:two-component sensor histidine kinase